MLRSYTYTTVPDSRNPLFLKGLNFPGELARILLLFRRNKNNNKSGFCTKNNNTQKNNNNQKPMQCTNRRSDPQVLSYSGSGT